MDPSDLLDRIADAPPVVVLLAVTALVSVDCLPLIGLSTPGDLLLLVPSAALGPSDAWVVFVGGVVGTMVGYQISFSLGKAGGPRLRRSWLGRRVGDERWRSAVLLLQGPAARALVAVQFLPVLNCIIPLLAGSLQVRRSRFFKLTFIGAIAYAALYTTLGATAGHAGDEVGDSRGQFVALLITAVTVTVIGTFLLTRASRKLVARADPNAAGEPDPGDGMDGDSRDVRDSITC